MQTTQKTANPKTSSSMSQQQKGAAFCLFCGAAYPYYTAHWARRNKNNNTSPNNSALPYAAFETVFHATARAERVAPSFFAEMMDSSDVEWEAQAWGENIAEDLLLAKDAAAAPPPPPPLKKKRKRQTTKQDDTPRRGSSATGAPGAPCARPARTAPTPP